MIIQENVSLADKNWFRTGGRARYFAKPTTVEECREAFMFARDHHLSTFFLGEGANILISDAGFKGVVICSGLTHIRIIEQTNAKTLVEVESGVTIQELIDWCLDHNLLGLEEFSGIPGTIGGAAYINIHYFDHLLSEYVVSGTVINRQTLSAATHDTDWFAFGYDTSRLHDHKHYLTSLTIRLRRGTELETAYARGRRDEIIRHRHKRYPYERTCGSFFRNFHVEEVQDDQLPFVAYYLDKLGIKGELRVGGAQVSHKHANMIVTTPGATSHDVINLARQMQEKVSDTFSLMPQPECQLIGFDHYPLHIQ